MMKKIALLGVLATSAAMADVFLFTLEAAFGQGVQANADFRQSGLIGPRASALSVTGASNAGITTNFAFGGTSAAPNATVQGFNMIFDSGARTSFTTGGPTNTWVFGTGGTQSFTLFGHVNLTGGPNPVNVTYAPLFTGTFTSNLVLNQAGGIGSTNAITLASPVTLNLTPVGQGTAFLSYFTTGFNLVTNARINSLSFTPTSGTNAGGTFNVTNNLTGSFQFSSVPEPASVLSLSLGIACLGLLKLRKKA